MRYTVPNLLEACGCPCSGRLETEARYLFTVQVPLALATVLYGALVGHGIVFDGPSHLEWSRLCTVQSFTARMPAGGGSFRLRLEIVFRKPVPGGAGESGRA